VSANEKLVLGEVIDIFAGDEVVRTKVQEVISDTVFVVLQPTIQGIPIRSEDNEFTFQFTRPNGCYSFRGKLHKAYQKDNLWLCKVERVSGMERSQRRQYYRLPIMLDIVIDMGEEAEKAEDAENGQAPKESRFCKGKTVNLSENSVEFTCDRAFEPGTKVVSVIKLTDMDAILLNAEVFRCEKSSKNHQYSVVLIFDNMFERERKILRRFVLQQQALMLKRRR